MTPLSRWMAVCAGVLAVLAPRQIAAAQVLDASTRGTRLIITAARTGHTRLGDQIADSLVARLRRRFPCRELEILTQRQADQLSLIEPLPDTLPLSIDDLRELAKSMAADVVVDLSIDQRRPAMCTSLRSSSIGVRARPTRWRQSGSQAFVARLRRLQLKSRPTRSSTVDICLAPEIAPRVS